MADACRSGTYAMREIAKRFGLHKMTVNRAVCQRESQHAE